MDRRHRQRREKKRGGLFRRLLGLFAIAAAVYWVIFYVMPNRLHLEPDWTTIDKPIFVKGEYTGYSASGAGEKLLLPLPFLQEYLDSSIRYEVESKSVILSTESELLYMQADTTAASLNNKPLQLRLAPEEKGELTFLPADTLKDLYGFDVQEDTGTGAIQFMLAGEVVPLGKVKGEEGGKSIALRHEPNIHAPIAADMPPGAIVKIWSEQEDWLFVQMSNGYTGYSQSKYILPEGQKEVKVQSSSPTRAEKSWSGKPVNLVWEAVYERKPNPDSIGKLPGVNVVSPTWFSIIDGDGNVRSQADRGYVQWAHKQGMEVWGLLSNSFDAEMTTSALSTYEKRMRIIVQMLEYCDLYGLDGINIDFENVYTKDGVNVTQFMRELKPMAQAKNLIVSIDVTPKSNSEMWSLFLDRRALGSVSDFIILMAYDEHWASSPKAGSVASLPWVERSISRIIEEDDVPPEKIILGVPLYTRIWSETKVEGKTKVSSKAVSMNAVTEIISSKKLEPKFDAASGQNVVEYKEDEIPRKIWIEDKVSLKARVQLAKKYVLGGMASWNRSFANQDAWETLNEIHQ